MKLKEYIEELQKIAQDYPDAVVVYSADDEGNYFEEVHFGPSVGRFSNGEWESGEDMQGKPNAVCIN
jgi:hypothetical protein